MAQGEQGQTAEPPGLLDGWLTRSELGKQLRISVDTLSRWETRRFGPPCVRIGRQVLYRTDAVRSWLETQEERARPKATKKGGAQ